MDVDALAETKGGKKGGKGKDKGGKSKKFEGNCFWCGVYGHMMEDCQKKAVWKPVPKSPQGPDPKIHRLMRKPPRRLQVSSLMLSADTRGTVNEICSVGQNLETSTRSVEIYKSGNLCANAVDAEL